MTTSNLLLMPWTTRVVEISAFLDARDKLAALCASQLAFSAAPLQEARRFRQSYESLIHVLHSLSQHRVKYPGIELASLLQFQVHATYRTPTTVQADQWGQQEPLQWHDQIVDSLECFLEAWQYCNPACDIVADAADHFTKYEVTWRLYPAAIKGVQTRSVLCLDIRSADFLHAFCTIWDDAVYEYLATPSETSDSNATWEYVVLDNDTVDSLSDQSSTESTEVQLLSQRFAHLRLN